MESGYWLAEEYQLDIIILVTGNSAQLTATKW